MRGEDAWEEAGGVEGGLCPIDEMTRLVGHDG
jgi:hypothetical protein